MATNICRWQEVMQVGLLEKSQKIERSFGLWDAL
jgi:hypothetical protein